MQDIGQLEPATSSLQGRGHHARILDPHVREHGQPVGAFAAAGFRLTGPGESLSDQPLRVVDLQ
jgi:hypothetical protein